MRRKISSPQNQSVKDAIKLRKRRARERQRRIVIDGVREIRCAATAGVEIVELFFCPQIGDPQAHAELLELTAKTGSAHLELDARVFDKVALVKFAS